MRLDKILANKGFGSRKDVRALIKKKHVTINDKVVKDSGTKVNLEKDTVRVNDTIISYREYVYILLNKPPGYISATTDNHNKTVIDLLPEAYQLFEPFPVGRLDKDTEGLLLITNDGDLGHQLTSPKKDVEKTYFAHISGRVTEADVQEFQKGVQLDDGLIAKPATLEILESKDVSLVNVTVTEGKFHQVKRMFEAVGKKVIYLKRIQMGSLKLDEELETGKFRELTESEINKLKPQKKG
ncbi:ribosomal small subunit pseudouridine synthase A [Lentibacillus persicus]|uniref:Pseudouridine synthase n=1 Tax=Lentibacillus persicus TaxID=640948 RepID=A0A1I1TZZ4_9BACI|nr:pseudouridine synthase [Lentibacillus persicus]SFD62003.1 ribosomal small subunit pseudouridine synthase A [Lentibacillus persicus]